MTTTRATAVGPALRTPEERFAEHEDRVARAVFSNTALPGSNVPALPIISAQQRLDPEVHRAVFGIDWRATVDDDDRILPDRVHALVEEGGSIYFPAWRVYAQEVAELWPSKIVPGWCLTQLSDHVCAAYDAPFPTQDHVVGARRSPLLVPITPDDPERARTDAAWTVLEGWTTRPVLTIYGDHDTTRTTTRAGSSAAGSPARSSPTSITGCCGPATSSRRTPAPRSPPTWSSWSAASPAERRCASHRRPASMTRWRNWRVRSSRGSPKI